MQLTATQQNVLNHLAAGKSAAQTAELCGVHRNTIANWRRDIPAFSAQLDDAIRERTLLFQELVPDAVEVLRTILHNEKASPSVRLRAALTVLKMATAPQREIPAQSCTTIPTPEPEAEPETELASFVPTVEIASKSETPAQNCTTNTRPQPIRVTPQPGRNSQCPCGSGVKYKRCCANAKPGAVATAA